MAENLIHSYIYTQHLLNSLCILLSHKNRIWNKCITQALSFHRINLQDLYVSRCSQVLVTRCRQALVHELPFGKAQPPLAGFICLFVEHFVQQAIAGLLPQLLQVGTHCFSFVSIRWLAVHRVQWKTIFPRDGKVGNSQCVHLFLTLVSGGTLL